MDRENSRRLWRRIRMFGQQEFCALLEGWFELFVCQRQTCTEVRPTVPGAAFDAPETIGGSPHGPASSIVISIVRNEQFSVRRKRQAKGIAKAPRDQLGRAAGWAHAENRSAALHLALDGLALGGGCAERHECAGRDFVSRAGIEDIFCGE